MQQLQILTEWRLYENDASQQNQIWYIVIITGNKIVYRSLLLTLFRPRLLSFHVHSSWFRPCCTCDKEVLTNLFWVHYSYGELHHPPAPLSDSREQTIIHPLSQACVLCFDNIVCHSHWSHAWNKSKVLSQCRGESKSRHKATCTSQVFTFSIFIMNKETRSVSKTPFYYLVLIQRTH